MINRVIDFYCFSGTGNTLMVAEKMRDVFAENGIEVNFFMMEREDPSAVDLTHELGLAFPVACQSTYLFVWDFIRALPEASGTEVFMVDTLDSFSGAIVGPLKKVLKAKGYKSIGAREIRMPGNWFPKKIDEDKNSSRIEKGLRKAGDYAQAITDGRSHWRRVPILSDALYFVCSRPKTWELMADLGKKFTVDLEKCKQCDICEDLCPVDNIVMGEYPEFQGHCQQCMRCISFCPSQAIYVPDKEYVIYKAVKVKELLRDKSKGEKGETG